MYDILKADFSLVMNTPHWILIRDNARETQTMSVTNDAENVVKYLKDNAMMLSDAIIFYIDTDDRVDILEHDGNGNFTGFKAGFRTEDEFWNATEQERINKWHKEVGFTDEQIELMKIKANERYENDNIKLKISQTLKGHKVSEETKKKISESVKRKIYERKQKTGNNS